MSDKLLSWVKSKLGLTALEAENAQLKLAMLEAKSDIKHHRDFAVSVLNDIKRITKLDADVGVRGNNTIILTGVFKGQAWCRFYDLGDGEFQSLVQHVREMTKYSSIRNIDKPPSMAGFDFDL